MGGTTGVGGASGSSGFAGGGGSGNDAGTSGTGGSSGAAGSGGSSGASGGAGTGGSGGSDGEEIKSGYFVKVGDGCSDSNDGLSPAKAWCTLNKVNSAVSKPGSDVWLHEGDQWKSQAITVDWAGSASDRVTLGAYYTEGGTPRRGAPGGRPTLDGEKKVPGSYNGLIQVQSDYVDIENLVLKNSAGLGIRFWQIGNASARNVKTDWTYRHAIQSHTCSNIVLDGCESVESNTGWKFHGESSWGAGLTAFGTNGFTVRNSIVREGWGEGISSFYGSSNVLVENNLVYAIRAVGIYIDSTKHAIVRNNIVLGTTDTLYHRSNGMVGAGIALNNEKYQYQGNGGKLTPGDRLEDVKLYGNLVAYTASGTGLWGQLPETDFKGVAITNNIFVDNVVQFGQTSAKPKPNAFFRNNALLSISSGTKDTSGSTALGGMIAENNYFSQGDPGGDYAHSGNVYSGVVLKKMTGWRSISSHTQVAYKDFVPQGASKTIGAGTKLLPAPFDKDYMGKAHHNPMDIGAFSK